MNSQPELGPKSSQDMDPTEGRKMVQVNSIEYWPCCSQFSMYRQKQVAKFMHLCTVHVKILYITYIENKWVVNCILHTEMT